MDKPKATRLHWIDEDLGTIELPKAPLRFTRSFGSGLSRRASDPPGLVWAVGDRGPNLKIKTLLERYGAEHLAPLKAENGAKVMPRLDVGPMVAQLQVDGERVRLVSSFPISDTNGQPVSGLPMAGSAHAVSEPAFSLEGERLEPDPSGLDSEGIAALEDGGFIVSEEFGPSLVRLAEDGRVIGRFLPESIAAEGALYPVHPTLPAIAAKRQLNRGFEGVAVSNDGKWLFVAFQSPLAHPDEATHERARHVRLWRIDLATMTAVREYLYPLDAPETFARDVAKGPFGQSDLKVSELVWLPGDRLLVLERGSETTKIYQVTLGDGSVIADMDERPTLEERSAAGEDLPSLDKHLLFSSDDAPEVSADLEGMAILSPTELLLVSDSDFGTEGAETAFWKLTVAAPVLC